MIDVRHAVGCLLSTFWRGFPLATFPNIFWVEKVTNSGAKKQFHGGYISGWELVSLPQFLDLILFGRPCQWQTSTVWTLVVQSRQKMRNPMPFGQETATLSRRPTGIHSFEGVFLGFGLDRGNFEDALKTAQEPRIGGRWGTGFDVRRRDVL